jgi:hypothetical protein
LLSRVCFTGSCLMFSLAFAAHFLPGVIAGVSSCRSESRAKGPGTREQLQVLQPSQRSWH